MHVFYLIRNAPNQRQDWQRCGHKFCLEKHRPEGVWPSLYAGLIVCAVELFHMFAPCLSCFLPPGISSGSGLCLALYLLSGLQVCRSHLGMLAAARFPSSQWSICHLSCFKRSVILHRLCLAVCVSHQADLSNIKMPLLFTNVHALNGNNLSYLRLGTSLAFALHLCTELQSVPYSLLKQIQHTDPMCRI